MMPTHKELVKRSLELYPTSRFMAKQWVRKSYYLYQTGAHLLLTGQFVRKH